MRCTQLEGGRWRLSFSEPEAAFIINVLARLARHYQDDLADLPPAVRAYWQGSISADQAKMTDDLQESQEMLAEARADLRSERLAEKREPWEVEITSDERDEFVAMLNDRRLTLALEAGISDVEMDSDPSHIPQDQRRSSILEIDVLGHFILVTLGPQVHRP